MRFPKITFCAVMAFSALLLFVPSAGFAAEEESPEHGKINTADASPVDSGHYEVEASYNYAWAKHLWDNNGDSHARGFTREHAAGLSLTAGIIDNLDINISGDYKWLRDKDNDYDDSDELIGPETGDHFGDLSFSARYRFLQNETYNLELAYIGGFTAPTGGWNGESELGTSQEYWSWDQTLAASKDWGKWTANADVGFALPFGDRLGNARGTFNTDVAVGYQVLPWLQPEFELNYSHDFIADADDAHILALTGGLIMPINELFRINVGIQQNVWGRNVDEATSVITTLKVAL